MQGKRIQQKSPSAGSVAPGLPPLTGAVWRDWRRRGDNDPSVLAELTLMFVRDADQRMMTLSDALAQGDAAECARAAHSLIAGCLQIGATRMARCCLDIECAAQCRDMDTVPELFQGVRDEYLLVRQALENAVAKNAADR